MIQTILRKIRHCINKMANTWHSLPVRIWKASKMSQRHRHLCSPFCSESARRQVWVLRDLQTYWLRQSTKSQDYYADNDVAQHKTSAAGKNNSMELQLNAVVSCWAPLKRLYTASLGQVRPQALFKACDVWRGTLRHTLLLVKFSLREPCQTAISCCSCNTRHSLASLNCDRI